MPYLTANTPVYDIVFALGAAGQYKSTIFEMQKNLIEKIMNFPSTADRNYGLIQYGPTADIRSHLEQYQDVPTFLRTMKRLSLPGSDDIDLTAVLRLTPDLFQSSAPDSNKILVIFTSSALPSDVRALATAARDLNRRDVRVVVVNTGVRTDHSNWLPDPSLVVIADPRNRDQTRTVHQIGNIVYRGNGHVLVLCLCVAGYAHLQHKKNINLSKVYSNPY